MEFKIGDIVLINYEYYINQQAIIRECLLGNWYRVDGNSINLLVPGICLTLLCHVEVNKPEFTPPFYVDCPTEEIWDKVIEKGKSLGFIKGGVNDWNHLKKHTFISFDCDGQMLQSRGKADGAYNEEPFISFEKFLGGFLVKNSEDLVKNLEINFGPIPKWQLSPVNPIKNLTKEKIMSCLNTIPAKIKRLLNANYRAFYQLGWVDEELDLTDLGKDKLMELLLDQNEAELGKVAMKEVVDTKKKEAKEEA